MKTQIAGVVVLALIILCPLLIWGVNYFNKEYQRYKTGQNLRALGQAQTVYSNAYNDNYEVQSGQIHNETFEGSDFNMESKFYSFTMNDIDGKAIPLSQYQGKVLLVVNVASKCGFTKQYEGLQQLYEKYKDQGFFILGFPANNFLSQEPGTDSEIKTFCTTKFNVMFPMFSKISVKGKDIHPLYQYLTSPEENGEFGQPISWNFNKFLIGRDGITVGYFGSRVEPLDPQMTDAVEKALEINYKLGTATE
jgi:glutathione peroxidase